MSKLTNALNKEQIENIKKVQQILLQIDMTGTAPINITLYEKKLGLVKVLQKTYKTPDGRKMKYFDKMILTEKGKRILAVVI